MNRIPSKVLKFKSPYQVLFSTKPDYNLLIVFGCLCYPLLRPYNRNKLEFRSDTTTFLGYNNSHKGYKDLLPNGNVIISRDVVFDEFKFPFAILPSYLVLQLQPLLYTPLIPHNYHPHTHNQLQSHDHSPPPSAPSFHAPSLLPESSSSGASHSPDSSSETPMPAHELPSVPSDTQFPPDPITSSPHSPNDHPC